MQKTDSALPVLDLRQLHYFVALAEHGSISAAAAALGLAQPSVSENIAKLEQRLNTQLAIRGPRGVTLTEAGRALATQGRDLLLSAAVLADEVRQVGGEVRGPVSIGFPPSLSLMLSVPLAETVHSELPNVRLHVAEGMSGNIFEWVEVEKLDMGCVYVSPDSAVFETHPIMTEELFLVAASDNLPADPDESGTLSVKVEALRNLPLVMPSMPQGARRVVERYARAHGVALNVVIEMDSLPQIIEIVQRASAYTVLPHAAVTGPVEAGQLSLIHVEPSLLRTAYLTRKRSRPASTASLAVQATMMKIIQEIIDRYHLKAELTDFAREQLAGAA
jgi:LysR family nitrogen assimilation transcriptional regulator